MWRDWVRASEMRRQATVIMTTHWTLAEFDRADRDRIDELLMVWSMTEGIKAQVQAEQG